VEKVLSEEQGTNFFSALPSSGQCTFHKQADFLLLNSAVLDCRRKLPSFSLSWWSAACSWEQRNCRMGVTGLSVLFSCLHYCWCWMT